MNSRSCLLLTLLLAASIARAGSNAGGTLILHANRSIAYTSDSKAYAGRSDLAACSLAVVTAPANPSIPTLFYAMAAFPPASSPRLMGITFGIRYDYTRFALLGEGPCGDVEIHGRGWPKTGTGTSVAWKKPRTSSLTEVYWFAGYTYTLNDTTQFAVTPHPEQGPEGDFGDDALPSRLDPIAGYGKLGFGMPGYLPCPGSARK